MNNFYKLKLSLISLVLVFFAKNTLGAANVQKESAANTFIVKLADDWLQEPNQAELEFYIAFDKPDSDFKGGGVIDFREGINIQEFLDGVTFNYPYENLSAVFEKIGGTASKAKFKTRPNHIYTVYANPANVPANLTRVNLIDPAEKERGLEPDKIVTEESFDDYRKKVVSKVSKAITKVWQKTPPGLTDIMAEYTVGETGNLE